MTKYETISVIVSIIAVALSILIPLTRWIWKRFIMQAKVKYYPTGQAVLFFNQSGSYIRAYGVLESEKKAATIKKMKIIITRQRDEQKLNLLWSYLISPVNQSLIGNSIQTTEAAHPFRVEADSVACAFVEFSDPSDSSGKKIRNICANLNPLIQQMAQGKNYNEALDEFIKSPEFLSAKSQVANDFFWEIGKYSLDIIVEYSKNKSKTFTYEFSVSEHDSMELRNNIDESIITQVKSYYSVRYAYRSPLVELSER